MDEDAARNEHRLAVLKWRQAEEAVRAAAYDIFSRSTVADQMMRDEYAAVVAQENPTFEELYTVWEMESRRRWLLLPPGFGDEAYPMGYETSPDVFEEMNEVHPWFYPHPRFRPTPLASPETIAKLKKLFEEADRECEMRKKRAVACRAEALRSTGGNIDGQ